MFRLKRLTFPSFLPFEVPRGGLIVLVPWHPSGRDDYEDDDELMMMIMEMMMTQIMIFRTKIVF